MSRRKTITPRAEPRQAEVVSLAAFRGLRSTHHGPELTLDLVRCCPEIVAGAEERFATTLSKRLGQDANTHARHKADVVPFPKLREGENTTAYESEGDWPAEGISKGDAITVRQGRARAGELIVYECDGQAHLNRLLHRTKAGVIKVIGNNGKTAHLAPGQYEIIGEAVRIAETWSGRRCFKAPAPLLPTHNPTTSERGDQIMNTKKSTPQRQKRARGTTEGQERQGRTVKLDESDRHRERHDLSITPEQYADIFLRALGDFSGDEEVGDVLMVLYAICYEEEMVEREHIMTRIENALMPYIPSVSEKLDDLILERREIARKAGPGHETAAR
jgi:hypothetical protein